MRVEVVWNKEVRSDYRVLGGDVEYDYVPCVEVFDDFDATVARVRALAEHGESVTMHV